MAVEMKAEPLGERLTRITLAGRLDVMGVDQVEARFLASMLPEGRSAIVDVSAVDFVSSMGLRMFMSAARSLRAKQAGMAIFGASTAVAEVFDAAALGRVMPICATEAEAKAAVTSPGV